MIPRTVFVFFMLSLGLDTGCPWEPQAPQGDPGRVDTELQWRQIYDMVVLAESGGVDHAWHPGERASGRMQVTPICLMEFNRWHPAWARYRHSDMQYPGPCCTVGEWTIGVRYYVYAYPGDIVTSVAAFNVGMRSIYLGWYPDDYLTYIMPGRWQVFKSRWSVLETWTNETGARLVRLGVKQKSKDYCPLAIP